MSRIIRPLQTITESSRNLSEGNLDFHIDVNSSNEIGVLADSLNTSVKNLKLYISDISMVLDEIAAGNLGKESAIQYIGDFVQIQKAIETISDQFCNTMEQIHSSSSQVDSGANEVAVGAQSMTGEEFRECLDLNSACFSIKEVEGKMRIVTKGMGHGVGLSQYGANEMAKAGSGYEEILNYYYQDVTIEKYIE